MTQPERGLFERICLYLNGGLYTNSNGRELIKQACAEFEQRLAEAEAKLAQAQSIVAQKDLALAAAKELLAETKTERDDLQKRMKGIRNVLGTITPSIAPFAVMLIAEAAMEITAPLPEKKHE